MSIRVPVRIQLFQDRPHLQLQWVCPVSGRRRTRSAGTSDPDQAERARADLEYELSHGLFTERSKRVAASTWADFRAAFLHEYVAPLRRNTREAFEDSLDSFVRLARPVTLASITERTLSSWVARLRTDPGGGRAGLLPSTIHLRLQHLRTALRWAVTQKLLREVPAFPAIKLPERKPQPVPAELVERLLAIADVPMRAYLLCGWLAGLRLTEAVELRWQESTEAPWVDRAGRRIVLPAAACKGNVDQWVPLDPALEVALCALPRHEDARVFRFVDERPGKRCGSLIQSSAVSDRVTALARLAGVRLTMHALRRGFACRYAARVPAQVLQKLMRHRRVQTTLEYYTNVDQAVREAVLGPKGNTECNIDREGARERGPESPEGRDATAAQIGTSVRS